MIYRILTLIAFVAVTSFAQLAPEPQVADIKLMMDSTTNQPMKMDFSKHLSGISDPGILFSHFSNRPLLIYYFSPKCPHCQKHFPEIQNLIKRGKANMMKYYDTQYPNIIKEAKRLESVHQFEEALVQVMAIPLCSKGGDAASKYALQLYMKYLDRLNLYLLNQARALWAANQDQATAYEVCSMLAQIDPDSKCYGDAAKLMKEVKAQVRSDIDLEMRVKYKDEIDLEKARIAAARAVGVAFGNGQKPTTTNIAWLR